MVLKNKRDFRYILVVTDNFSRIVWTIPFKNKHAQSITDVFSRIVKPSKLAPNLLETDDGKQNVSKSINEILKQKKIKEFSRNIGHGAVFAEQFNETIRKLTKKACIRKGIANWISEIPSVIKKHKNTIHHSTKMTSTQASSKRLKK